MRYRLTVISIVAVALVAAAVVFGLNRNDDSLPERSQTELFPDGLGVVGAVTATARAGGGATIDPTALVTPSSTVETAAPTGTAVSENTATPVPPTLRLSSDEVAPGGLVSVEISGASPDENFDLAMGTTPVGNGMADSSGNAMIEVIAPRDLPPQTIELTFTGAQSSSSAVSITISNDAPMVNVDSAQSDNGESVSIAADNFSPGESITIRISGQPIASGIADNEGSFSVTTGVPESLAANNDAQTLSAEGNGGSVAMTRVNLSQGAAVQPTATALAGDSGQDAGSVPPRQENGMGEPDAGPADEQDSDGGDVSLSNLPAWIYFAAGVLVGWLALLTLWVMRLDRSRDRWVAAMVSEIRRADEGSTSKRIAGTPLGEPEQDESQSAA